MNQSLISKANEGKETQKVVPGGFHFNHDVVSGPKNRVEWVKLIANSAFPCLPSGKINFPIPNDGIYDFNEGGLLLTIITSFTAGTFARLPIYVDTIIKKLIVRIGSTDIEDMDLYNVNQVIRRVKSTTYLNDVRMDSMLAGNLSTAQRNAVGAAGRKYFIPISAESLTGHKVHGTKGNYALEIQIDTAAAVIESDNVAGTFSITSCELCCQKEMVGESFKMMLNADLQSQPLLIPFHTWSRQSSTLSAGISSTSIIITEKCTSLKQIYVIMRTQSTLNTQTTLNRMEVWNKNDLFSYQFNANGILTPSQPVLGLYGVEPFIQLAKIEGWWNAHELKADKDGSYLLGGDPATPGGEYNTTRFLMAHNFEEHPKEGMMNGLDLSSSSGNLNLDLVFGTVLPSIQQVDLFLKVQRIMKIHGNGQVEVFK